MAADACIQLTAVGKGYREAGRVHGVLRDVHARFGRGGFYVIQGRSGSGKTTLLNLLGGIDLPDTGEVRVDGQLINRLDERRRALFRRHSLGFVFQAFNLIPTLNVTENLAFPLELNGVRGAAAARRVDELLPGFGLAGCAQRFPDQLSGGEQQRVAIARAVIHTPAVVLADEPTGNLDLETERQVLDLLRSLPREHGVTVVCATHSAEVAAAADGIFHLEQGHLSAA